MKPPKYAVDYPDNEDVPWLLDDLVTFYEFRDNLARRARDMEAGRNEITLPKAKGWVPVARRTFKLKSILNMKLSRFGHLPEAAIIARSDHQKHLDDAQAIENWLREAMAEINRKANGFWLPAVLDALILDEGWVRVDRAPAAFWPDLVPVGEDEDPETISQSRRDFMRLFESSEKDYEKAKEEYKQRAGVPIRCEYVPAEQMYVYREGGQEIYNFELDYRPLRSVLENPLFDTSDIQYSMDYSKQKPKMTEMVPIAKYSNQAVTAYYVLSSRRADDMWFPGVEELQIDGVAYTTHPIWKFEHGLGNIPYARIPGRFGGWRAEHNGIESVTEALCEMNQYLDELLSQAFTNVRARFWPTKIVKLDPEKRGETKGRPQPINTREGGDITLWNTEEVGLLFEAQDDPIFQFVWSAVEDEMSSMGGAPALFGLPQAGVETGYHESLRISQAESLDAMISDGLAQGWTNVCTRVLQQVKAIGEPVYAQHVGKSAANQGRRVVKSIKLDPDQLDPMPKIDSQITKPRPLDLIAMIRAAIDLTSPYGDKPPLASQRYAREVLLQIDDPAYEESRIRIEAMVAQGLGSGVIQQDILEKLKLAMVQDMAPGTDANTVAQSDPALLDSIREVNQNEAADPLSGGVDPRIVNDVDKEFASRRTPGPPPGGAQPEQVLGREIASRSRQGVAR